MREGNNIGNMVIMIIRRQEKIWSRDGSLVRVIIKSFIFWGDLWLHDVLVGPCTIILQDSQQMIMMYQVWTVQPRPLHSQSFTIGCTRNKVGRWEMSFEYLCVGVGLYWAWYADTVLIIMSDLARCSGPERSNDNYHYISTVQYSTVQYSTEQYNRLTLTFIF